MTNRSDDRSARSDAIGPYCPGGCITPLESLALADTVVRLDGSVSCRPCWTRDQADFLAERADPAAGIAKETGLSLEMVRAHNISGEGPENRTDAAAIAADARTVYDYMAHGHRHGPNGPAVEALHRLEAAALKGNN